MSRLDDPRVRRAPRWLLVGVAVVAILVPSGTALADVSTRYAILGAEVWATPTVGTFVGGANGSSGDVASWAARIEHTVQTQPGGKITGGWATLYTSELTRIHGRFSHGTLRLVDDGGSNCGDLRHIVKARLVHYTSSDSDVIGTGRLEAVLIHYRVEILGMCVAYSASVNGTITFSF
jgi:hypothetical protein